MHEASHIDFLSIGHICYDLAPGGRVMGGSAAYASSVAHVLGCRSAVLTSAAVEDRWQAALPQISVEQIAAPTTTCFENVYDGGTRQQIIHSVAGPLTIAEVPPGWERTAIAHLAPIANEVERGLIDLFSNSLVGLSPQGWMRRWDADGHVYAVEWSDAERMLPLAAATFISEEDLQRPNDVERYAALSPLLVQTAGADGCVVYCRGERRKFAAPAVTLIDPTGAGDVFAASFLVRLLQTGGDPWESAKFANVMAAQTVTQRGIAGKMTAIQTQLASIQTIEAVHK